MPPPARFGSNKDLSPTLSLPELPLPADGIIRLPSTGCSLIEAGLAEREVDTEEACRSPNCCCCCGCCRPGGKDGNACCPAPAPPGLETLRLSLELLALLPLRCASPSTLPLPPLRLTAELLLPLTLGAGEGIPTELFVLGVGGKGEKASKLLRFEVEPLPDGF